MGNQQGGKKEEVEEKQGNENEKINTDPAKHYKVVVPIRTDLLAERKAEEEQRQKDIEDEQKDREGKDPSEENEGEEHDEETLEKMRRERTLNRLRRDRRNQNYYCDGCQAAIRENRYHCAGTLLITFKESFLSLPPGAQQPSTFYFFCLKNARITTCVRGVSMRRYTAIIYSLPRGSIRSSFISLSAAQALPRP